MKKISLLALAVPALFAACQDELVTDSNNQQSAGLLGEVAGKIDFVLEQNPLTRVTWGEGDPTPGWNDTDKFSLFWAEENANATYNGKANAVYYVEKGETSKFASQSVIYEGKHILVSPADLTHTSNKEIVVKVGAEQEESKSIGDRTILVSDNLLEIKAEANKLETDPEGTIYAGYNKVVNVPVSALSSNVHFNLTFKKAANDVEVKKVELIALDDKKPFVTEANLTVNENGHVSAVPTANGTTGLLTVNFQEGTIVPESGVLPVHFSMLPSVVAQLSEETTVETPAPAAEGGEAETPAEPTTTTTYTKYAIKVYTSYGVVTIDKANLVYKGSGDDKVYMYDGTLAEDAKVEDQPLGFFEAFYDNAVRDVASEEGVTPAVTAETSTGNHTIRTVEVDMSTADINGMVIETSDKLVEIYGIYQKLGKCEAKAEATFTLQPATSTFEMSAAAAALILNKDYAAITLENSNVTAIELQAGITEIPVFSNIEKNETDDLANIDLILGAEGTWAMNVQDAANFNAWKSIINNGTLTVSSEDVEDGVDLEKALTNNASVTFGEVVFPANYTQNNVEAASTAINANFTFEGTTDIQGGSLTIAAGYQAYFNETTSAGDITVNGYLNAAGNFENEGTLTNKGVVIIAAGGTFVNKNEMMIEASASRTYINANEGTITIADRKENLVISEDGKQGVIAYAGVEADYAGGKFVGQAGDKFNKLTVTQANLDLTGINNAGTTVTSLVLDVYNAGAFESFTFADDATFEEVVLGKGNEGTQTYSVDFISANLTIGKLTVMTNTELHVVPGSQITYTGTGIDNHGSIAVGGVFAAANMVKPNFAGVEKQYKSAGYGGSFIWGASTQEEFLQNQLNAGGEVTLNADVELSEALTIADGQTVELNLNGKTISYSGTDLIGVFEVSNGKLTINGEGTVNAGSSIPVWGGRGNHQGGGEIIINGGNFVNSGSLYSAVYADGQSKITINGGSFKMDTADDEGKYWPLNTYNSNENGITVVEGKFYKFNPQTDDALGTSFIAEGSTCSEEDADGWYTVSKN